jgi:hypothetical protein
MRNDRWKFLAVCALALPALELGTAKPASAQVFLEARGGLNVPTFNITDVAKGGPSAGLGLGFHVTPELMVMVDGDFGSHPGADGLGGVSLPDVNVYHLIGKLGYRVYSSADGRLGIALNAGAGAMMFDVDGASSTETYPAINVGAKLTYALSPQFALVLSPQGNIAFSDEDVVGTSNSWVWPFGAGLRVTL